MSNYNRQPEKIESSSDITQTANNDTQLNLEDNNLQDFSQYLLNEIVDEMCNLYNEEIMKNHNICLILDTLEQFLIKKKQNPENIINFCLDNPINSIVQIILASCYRYGKWFEKDKRKAFNYYQKSAEMDDSHGICLGGVCYINGIGVEKDVHKAFIYFQKSAEMGDAEGTNHVGYCYHYGIGVEEDEYKAFIYYQKSADMGYALGISNVGYCYKNGIGVKKDEHKAFIYCQKAAAMGNAIGTYNVGNCYRNGIGVEKNEKKAFEYYKKSAEIGYADGMYYVGEFYRQGIIVKKNIDIAFEWYLKSAITEQYSRGRKQEYFHWIPYNKFENIEEIGKGAFSTVFKVKYQNRYGSYENVAIKIVKGSNKNKEQFLNELKACHSLSQYLGISRDERTKDYILVLSYARYGSLSKNLTNIFKFEWSIKLQILRDILSNLYRIHTKGYLHRDLHPGNILLKENYEAYITDLGLSKPLDEKEQVDRIYGVLPYIAPEIFRKKRYTRASDIYSFGIIMAEMTTGQRPFNDYKYDIDLAIMVRDFELRPKFAPGTPDCYFELAIQCMNSNPKKRPNVNEIITKLHKWLKFIKNKKLKIKSGSKIKMQLEIIQNMIEKIRIKKQFLESDKISKNLPIITEKSNNIYTSKSYSISEFGARLSKIYATKTADDIEVPDDY